MGLLVSRRLVVAGAAAAMVALGLGGTAGSRSAGAFDEARLSVVANDFGGRSFLAINTAISDLETAGGPAAFAARIDIATPPGYVLDLSGAPGDTVGGLIGIGVTGDGADFDLASSVLVVDDPATWAADPVAQACAPGPHAALWRANVTVFDQSVSMPVAVDTVAGASQSYMIHVCPTQPASSAFPQGVGLESADLVLSNVSAAPTVPGVYHWSAVVVPTATGTSTPQPSAAFELRAVQRIPNVLTVHARLDATSNTIAITGKLVAAGTPWAGAAVFLFADTGGSGGFDPAPLGEVQTARDGSFSAHVPATQSEMITASLATGGHPCSGASTAPAGCLSETDTPPSAAHATVIVPRATDPKLSVRSADQARAQKSVLRLGDFPNGTDYGGPPLPCAAFRPKLSRLVATGDALSDLIYGADGHVSAFAHATVLRSQSDAHTDFNGVAQLAALRCETNELKAEYEDDRILSIGPLRIPRIGTEARAFRAQLSDPLVGQYLEDIVFIRAGRVVITLHTFAYDSTNLPLDLRLARALAKRAAQ